MKEEEIELIKREYKQMGERMPRRSSSPTSTGRERERERGTVGILRLDFNKPRGSSGSSVEFRTPSGQEGVGAVPVSPQPSVLSVTFAEEPSTTPTSMDKVRFEADNISGHSEGDDDEDYSQSVSAIFQRKASTRRSRKRRRSSSPMFTQDGDDSLNVTRNRRRSSVFTTSSGDTGITVEDAAQEQILQNIKLHKEVLSSVKQQPWNMRRKLRLVRQAQAYIRRHEGELQERLAQSRSTRDILARFNIVIIKQWQYTKRELANLMNVLIPWEIRIKEIESHFGSVVASYFTFLRWLFWVNLVTAVVLITFLAVPEMLMANTAKSGMRKKMMEDELINATKLFTLWDFDGVLKYSPLFYGYYSHQDSEEKSLAKKIGYTMPLAYFLTELVVYIYSFVAILRRMAENSRQSKLSEKDEECVFTWKVFTGWDYMIGNAETAHNRTASIILGFKEALLEEAEKKRDEGRNWKVTSLRVFAHLNVLWLLGSSVYAVILVVDRSTQPEAEHGWWRKNEITIVVSLITSLFPAFFEGLGIIEQYHPRKKLRMQLARIMALNLLNIYTLIFASFSKINEMSNILEGLRPNNASYNMKAQPQVHTTLNQSVTPTVSLICKNISVPCPSVSSTTVTAIIMSLLLSTNDNSTTKPNGLDSSTLSYLNKSSPTYESSPYSTRPNNDLNNLMYYVTYPYLNNSTETTTPDANLSESVYVDFSENETALDYEFLNEDNYTIQKDNVTLLYSPSNSTVNADAINASEISLTTTFIDTENKFTTTNIPQDNISYPDSSSPTLTDSFMGSNETLSSLLPTASTIHRKPSEHICYETICNNVTESQPINNETINASTIAHSIVCSDSKVVQFPDLTPYIDTLDVETRKKLRPLCWETMFGREMVKLTVMDLVMTVVSTLMVDFFRAIFVRYMNNCWCWDLEKKFPQYGDFKIAENILHLVNNQGMVWMGMFFSPGLPLINIIKLAIMMYLRSWAVLTCNVPHEVVFRASRSNNFYFALLLTMLFLCVLPVGYAVVWVVPSWHCGPFSNNYRIYYTLTTSVRKALPYKTLHKALDYIASPSIIIPLLMLLVLIIYYLISLTSALREANNDLKIQLRRERTEERRKMFQLVDKKRQEAENPVLKWKRAIPNFPQGKISIADIPIDILKLGALNGSEKINMKQKEFLKKAKRLPSGTSEEESGLLDADGTDVEQHDSLPYDVSRIPKIMDTDMNCEKASIKIEGDKNKDSSKRNRRKKNQIKNEKEASTLSAWSGIPEIRIIQTESAENIDEVDMASMISSNVEKHSQKKTKNKNIPQEKLNNFENKLDKSYQTSKVDVTEAKNSTRVPNQNKTNDCSPKYQTKFKETDEHSFEPSNGEHELIKKNNVEILSQNQHKPREKEVKPKNLTNSICKESKDDKCSSEHNLPSCANDSGMPTFTEDPDYENVECTDGSDELTEECSKGDDSDGNSVTEEIIEPEPPHSDMVNKKISKEKEKKYSKELVHRKKINAGEDESGNSETSNENTQKEGVQREHKTLVDCDKENCENSLKAQNSKDPIDKKRFMARFKIANVLLKEARRKSCSKLED